MALVNFQLDAQNSVFIYNTFIKILFNKCIVYKNKEFCASSWKLTKVILRCTANQSSRVTTWVSTVFVFTGKCRYPMCVISAMMLVCSSVLYQATVVVCGL